jgi:hypothetical protein
MEYCEHNRAAMRKLFSPEVVAEHDSSPATLVVQGVINPAYVTAAYELYTFDLTCINVGPAPIIYK